MEFAELKAAAERARRFTHEIDGKRFELVTPTQFAVNVLTEQKRHYTLVSRDLLLAALRGWAGVTTADLRLPDGEDASGPLPFTVENAALLFDERSDWEEALVDAISLQVESRRKRLGDARGN